MNIDDIFDKAESHPIGFILGMWIIGGIISLIGLTVALLIIVGILSGFGVI